MPRLDLVRRLALLAAAAALAAATPAGAADVPKPPMALPGDASAATVAADPGTWLLGARPSVAAWRLVRALGGTRVVRGAFEVPRARARVIAAQLRRRGLLTFAEPNRLSRLAQAPRAVPDDPYDARSRWRDAAIDPALPPPPVTPTSPLLALVDAKADVTHPEFQGGNVRSLLASRSVRISHGTQTLGVAVAPANGVGIVGTYPGARAVNIPVPSDLISCADSARGIRRAVSARALVINMSYGASSFCQAEYQAVQLATHENRTLVAAGGNERGEGNPYEYPASLPHVLTVGALTPRDEAAFFSNTSAALDLVAPGVGLIAPTPVRLDTRDGGRDGYELVSGTSFAAPIVAGAALWLRTARPELTSDQAAQLLRLTAIDIAKKGYDVETGYGKLSLARALGGTPPAADPLEPNEDLPFVTGAAFGRPAAPIWSGGDRRRFDALLDVFEDPGDVYRVRVPARSRVTITTRPKFGNVDLDLYSSAARHVGQRSHRLDRSRHDGRRADRVRYRNRGRTRNLLVRAYVRAGRTLDARYTLTVRR